MVGLGFKVGLELGVGSGGYPRNPRDQVIYDIYDSPYKRLQELQGCVCVCLLTGLINYNEITVIQFKERPKSTYFI